MALDDPIIPMKPKSNPKTIPPLRPEGRTDQNAFSISKKIMLHEDCHLQPEGDEAGKIFLVIDGTLKISRYDAEHKQNNVIATLRAGDTVGEVSLQDSRLCSASACEKSLCRLRNVSFADLLEIADQDKAIYSIFYRLISLRTSGSVFAIPMTLHVLLSVKTAGRI